MMMCDPRYVIFGDGESKLSLLDLNGEGEEEAALHLMPNVQVQRITR